MKATIDNYLEKLAFGSKQSHKNLEVIPLLADDSVTLNYLTLDEALQAEAVEVVEIDEAGSVPQLKVVNKSDKAVLILDGEALVGARQNRIVNTTILIAAGAVTVIPVSCVEQGRWSYKSVSVSLA